MDEHGQARAGLRHEVAEGLRYVLGNRYLRHIAGSTGTSNLFTGIAFATLIVYLARDLELSAATIGIVFGIGNAGAIAGALTANRVAGWLGVGPTIVWSMFISGPAVLLVAVAPKDAAVPFLIASGLLMGYSSVVYNVNQVSFRQAITPERMQGRMNATMRFIVWGTIPIGQLVGGVIATAAGTNIALWIGGIGSCTAFLWVFFSPVLALREMPAPVEGTGAAGDAAAFEAGDRQRGARGVDPRLRPHRPRRSRGRLSGPDTEGPGRIAPTGPVRRAGRARYMAAPGATSRAYAAPRCCRP